ncbi:MAG: DUF58 domain-containing protein [Bacteroidetes bacterium]|nr:DUF58 domain-containing protein [Bacteroidota bacterium]
MAKEFKIPGSFHAFDNLELLAKQAVEGFIIGLHKSPYHGFSVEFAEHRLYNSGESVKNIDWKVYARTDKMYVKRFEEETNLRCQIVLDTSSSMFFPEKPADERYNKIQFSVVGAAAMMYLLRRQRDAVGLTLFDEAIKTSTQCKTTSTHLKMLQTHLYHVVTNEHNNKPTAAAQCLHQLAETLHKRSMVIIFSDMMDNVDDLPELLLALQHLKHNKHEVIVFHVHDEAKELDFDFENRPYKFVDLETNESIKLQPNQVKEMYMEKMAAIKKEIKLKCAQYKIDFIEADVNKSFGQILLPFMLKRGKMY